MIVAALALALAATCESQVGKASELKEASLMDVDEEEVEHASTVEDMQKKLDEEVAQKELSSSQSSPVLEEWDEEDAEGPAEAPAAAEEALPDKKKDLDAEPERIDDEKELEAEPSAEEQKPPQEQKASQEEADDPQAQEEKAAAPAGAETVDDEGVEINVSSLKSQGSGIPDVKEFVESVPTLKRLEDAKNEKKKKKPREKPFLLFDKEKEIFLAAQEKNRNRYQPGIENIEAELQAPKGPSFWRRAKAWVDGLFDKFADKYGSSEK